jgi:hypothetical protein
MRHFSVTAILVLSVSGVAALQIPTRMSDSAMFVSPFEAKVLAFENEMGSAVGTDLVSKEMTRINGRIELIQHPTNEKVEYRASMKYKITWTPPTPDSQAPTLIRVKLSPYINGAAVENGVAEAFQGIASIYRQDSSDTFFSGMTMVLPKVHQILSMQKVNGEYVAYGNFQFPKLAVTRNNEVAPTKLSYDVIIGKVEEVQP